VSDLSDVDDGPSTAEVVRTIRAAGMVSGLALAILALARLAPPLVSIVVVPVLAIVGAVLYLRTVHPLVGWRRWGLLSFVPVGHRWRYLGVVVPALVVGMWLIGSPDRPDGWPGGPVLAAALMAVGMILGTRWASSGLDRR
jgi:hypothetical protein